MTTVTVRVDDRLRLAGCLLAASGWPEREQELKPYRPHRVAEGARWGLASHRTHPAVAAAYAVAASGDEGVSTLFTQAMAGTWPGGLASQVADFAAAADLANYWQVTAVDWLAASADLQALVSAAGLGTFLSDFLGGLPGLLVVHPNLLYPGRQAVTSSVAGEYVLSQPPPQAWGSSVPWHYRERPDEVLGALAEGFVRGLLAQRPAGELAALGAAGVAGLPVAAAVLFLRQADGPAAADQFMVVEQRMRGLSQLAAMVNALEGRHGWGEIDDALRGL